MPAGTNAPKLCPAEPVSVMSIVLSGRPAPPHRFVTSCPSSVPTVRLTLRTGRLIVTWCASRIAVLRQLDEGLVERLVEPVVLPDALDERLAVRVLRHPQDRGDVEPRCLPVVDGLARVEALDVADQLVHGAEAELGHDLAHLGGDELEEVDDELGVAAEPRAQLRVLRGHADRARVEVTHPHHDAARHDERSRGESVLLGTEQRRDDHVATGLHLAVGLHDDAVAQAVEQQRLLRLGESEFPGTAGMLERGERAGPVPPS